MKPEFTQQEVKDLLCLVEKEIIRHNSLARADRKWLNRLLDLDDKLILLRDKR